MKPHDRDAGGSPEILRRKRELRERFWERLRSVGADRFPGLEGRIPNFVGAERAADRLRETSAWREATALKSNPDSPQWPVRQRALEDGLLVYMAVPRLAEERPFFQLDPERLEDSPRQASSIKGAARNARHVGPGEMRPIDLVVTGCVAASSDGARLGKGGGFSDLEYAVAAEAGLVTEETLIVTTVHEAQVADPGELPMTGHDVPLDLIVTPKRTIRCDGSHERPTGVVWGELREEKIAAVPLLRRLRPD